ncbi:hypothetical protein U1Q18_002791 [Sarracenia purpurea var. burkii]
MGGRDRGYTSENLGFNRKIDSCNQEFGVNGDVFGAFMGGDEIESPLIENPKKQLECNQPEVPRTNFGEGQTHEGDSNQIKKEILGKLKNEDKPTAKEQHMRRKWKKLTRTSTYFRGEPKSARQNKRLAEAGPTFADGADKCFELRNQSKKMRPDTHSSSGDSLIIKAKAVP